MRLTVSDRSILCIDWDEGSLRVLDALLSRSGLRVRKAVHVFLPPEVNPRSAESLGGFLRRTLAEHRIRTRRATVDFPRQDVLLNHLSLPRAPMDELSAMVNIQIAKDLPFSKDQAVIDFVLDRDQPEAETCNVWVGAVRNQIIDHYRQVISTAKLKLARIGLRPYANREAIIAAYPIEGRTLVVDIGPAMTEIDVIQEGQLVYSRAASVTVPPEGLVVGSSLPASPAARPSAEATIPFADDGIAKPSALDTLVVEVSRTVQAYRSTDAGATIDRIVLAGTVEINEHVVKAFENNFNSPVHIYELPESLRWPRFKDVSSAGFSAAIGLAMGSATAEMYRFDFLHPKEPEADRRERAKRVPMIAATIALFVAAACVVAYQPIRNRNSELAAIKADIKDRQENKKDREEILKLVQEVQTWQSNRPVWLDSLKLLADKFPSNKEVYITKWELMDKGKIDMEIVAVDEMVATKIVDIVSHIKDDQGKAIFTGRVGMVQDSKDPKYPVSDEVSLEIRSMIPKKNKKG